MSTKRNARLAWIRAAGAVTAVVALGFAAIPSAVTPGWAGFIRPVEVRFCGQQLSGEGILNDDLDCTDPQFDGTAAVFIKHLGRLDLNGFSITKGRGKPGVRCEGVCEVFGGTLDALKRARAGVSGRKRVTIDNMVIEGGWTRGVRSARGVRVLNSIVRQARSIGVRSNKRTAIIRNSEITGNGLFGVSTAGIGVSAGRRAEITDSLITGNFRFGVFVENGRAIIEGTILEENNLQVGCDTPEVNCRDACAEDALVCQAGCAGADVDCLLGCTTVGEACEEACIECADIATLYEPKLETTTCDFSLRLFPGVPLGTFPDQDWDICAFD